MGYRRLFCLGAALSVALWSGAAAAQDAANFARSAAGLLELTGEGLGEAARGGASILVTATGKARLPTPLVETFELNIEGTSDSAVEASRLRDQKLSVVKATAARHQIGIDYGQSTITPVIDQAAVASRRRKTAATGVTESSSPLESEVHFVARSTLKFSAPGGRDLAPFLDDLRKAGIGLVASNGTVASPGGLFNAAQIFGLGQADQVAPAIWDDATKAALAEARREAEVIAGASGRSLGAVRQVTVFSRSASGAEASVTVCVRYDFRAP